MLMEIQHLWTKTGTIYHSKTKIMTFIEHSVSLIEKRGEIAKQKLSSFITDQIIDEATQELINKLRSLLVIDKVRLN